MCIKKFVLRAASGSVVAIISFAAHPAGAQTASQAERLEKLEHAVEQLQKRNAELEQEIGSLKKQAAVAPEGRPSSRRKNYRFMSNSVDRNSSWCLADTFRSTLKMAMSPRSKAALV